MTKKKKVPLDVFKEAVLPMLKAKHATEPENLQKAIDDEYEIYREADGKEIPIAFSVSVTKTAPVKTEAEIEAEIETKVAAKVAAIAKASPTNVKRIKQPDATLDAGAGGDPTKSFKIPAECKRFGAPKHFAAEKVGDFDADERAYRFGMWGLAVRGSATAQAWCAEHGIGMVEKAFGDELLQKLHQENVNTTGGYLVPEEFGRDLIVLREQYGVARRVLMMVPMSSDTRTDPRQTGGLTASFVGEGAAGSESTTSWDNVRLTAKDIMVLTRMTKQVDADAIINFGDKLAYECGYATSLLEDQCAFIGDASATYGGIEGFSAKLIRINGVDDGGGVVLAAGNLFSEFVLADFNKAVGRIPQYADNDRTCWVAHRSFYYGTMQRLELAAGGVTASEVRAGSRRPRPLFLGYPVEFSQTMPSADVNSQIAATFGDHSMAASFGDRQQTMVTFSEHASVGGQSVFERNQVALRCVERIDMNIHDVGTATVAGPVVGLISAAS
jgi:HK97 family phage major capsid protein